MKRCHVECHVRIFKDSATGAAFVLTFLPCLGTSRRNIRFSLQKHLCFIDHIFFLLAIQQINVISDILSNQRSHISLYIHVFIERENLFSLPNTFRTYIKHETWEDNGIGTRHWVEGTCGKTSANSNARDWTARGNTVETLQLDGDLRKAQRSLMTATKNAFSFFCKS